MSHLECISLKHILHLRLAPFCGCGNNLVDSCFGETSVAEAQDWDAVRRADSALYRADLAYSKLQVLCRLIWIQPNYMVVHVCSLCALSDSRLLSSAFWGSNFWCVSGNRSAGGPLSLLADA